MTAWTKGGFMQENRQEKIFKTLIVGIDFSEYSKIVVRQAQKIARQIKANLVLIHAAAAEWPTAETGIYIPPASLKELAQEVEKFYRVKSSPQLSIVVRYGFPDDVLLKAAKKYPKPLIFVGSQGKNAVSRYILGSHAEQVALKATCPVWVQRGRKLVDFKSILVPTDLSNQSREHIHQMQKRQKRLPVSLDFLYVTPEVLPLLNYEAYHALNKEIGESVKVSIRKFREAEPGVAIKTVPGNDPSKRISLTGKKYDVIAMNPHTRSGMLNKFGRITSKVIRLSDNPVLVVKA
jgi:nucleotide-binding universal stress UspA family protein